MRSAMEFKPQAAVSRLVMPSVLLLYAAVLYSFRGNFELTSDDGQWLTMAQHLVNGGNFPLYGVVSSQGIPDLGFAAPSATRRERFCQSRVAGEG